MKLASYFGVRTGFYKFGSALIKWRLKGKYSHNEIMFEPGDAVDHLMPDGTCAPDSDGAYWMASSVAMEKLPSWSVRRAGSTGGIRFKRIIPNPTKWDIIEAKGDSLYAAKWFKEHEGAPYDWQSVGSAVFWLIKHKLSRYRCDEACASALNIPEPWRLECCSLHAVVTWK